MEARRFRIGGRESMTGRFALVRLPDGLTLSAGSWDDVSAACPEFGIPWRNVEFVDVEVRDQVLEAWGARPDMSD